MMKRLIVVSSLGVLVLGGVVRAQAPPAPKPGAEHKPMGYFVGKWKSEGEMKAGPMGPGGKLTSTDTCEWFAGGFHVVCRGEGTGPMGKMSSIGVIGYSQADKAYTFYGIDNMGTGELAHGQKSGGTWTYTSTSNFAGQTFQSRYTITETSPTAYTFKWESSMDKKTWMVVMEGKATKAS
jgi:hypothetical protein